MDKPDSRLGTTVGNYRLLEILGQGGMGVVYRAEHVYIGKHFAVKVLHDKYAGKDEAVERFLREAQAASLINHPNIVDVTDFGKLPDHTTFFVMEYLRGDPLDAVLYREKRLDLLRVITILNQMTRALGAAHAMGIVHRDLKPENVMLTRREGRRELVRHIGDPRRGQDVIEREQEFDFVKILDFGVAKMIEPEKARVTQHGVVLGTPEYMAPETARTGRADQRSDVYALGVMFYEMLTGDAPFVGDTAMDVMLKQVQEAPIPPRVKAPDAEITPEAERLILRALAKEPGKRQQTMDELHEELQGCYGSVRYRRSQPKVPGGASPESLRKPMALTKKKGAAAAGEPIPLTKKKSSGARTAIPNGASNLLTPPPVPPLDKPAKVTLPLGAAQQGSPVKVTIDDVDEKQPSLEKQAPFAKTLPGRKA